MRECLNVLNGERSFQASGFWEISHQPGMAQGYNIMSKVYPAVRAELLPHLWFF